MLNLTVREMKFTRIQQFTSMMEKDKKVWRPLLVAVISQPQGHLPSL